jgi:uncharacterized membrane protein YeaQ/YmgE (transglycosylase-associated protein family)
MSVGGALLPVGIAQIRIDRHVVAALGLLDPPFQVEQPPLLFAQRWGGAPSSDRFKSSLFMGELLHCAHITGVKAERSGVVARCRSGRAWMYLSNQSLIVILVVGVVAGWLAGQVVVGGGFGLIGDLVVGVIGAFIGDWLLPRLGVHLGSGLVSLIVSAAIGAIVLLLILRLFAGRRGGVGWGWRRRW